MKKLMGMLFVSAFLPFTAFAGPANIITGIDLNGNSSRTFLEGDKVVIAKCATFSVHEAGKKCEELSRIEFQSREDFMQQAIYQIVTHGSKDKETQDLVNNIRKLKDSEQSQRILEQRENDLKSLVAKEKQMLAFFEQTGQQASSSKDYQNLLEAKKVIAQDLKNLEGQKEQNSTAVDSLEMLKSLLAGVYEDIASADVLKFEDNNSFAGLVIKELAEKERKDLSATTMFRKASDLTVEEILAQKCRVSYEKGMDLFSFSRSGYEGTLDTYKSAAIYIYNSSRVERVGVAVYKYGMNNFFSGDEKRKFDDNDSLTYLSKEELKNHLLAYSSHCHDINELPLVTGVVSLEELRDAKALRKIQPIERIESAPLKIDFKVTVPEMLELPSVRVSQDERESGKEVRTLSKKERKAERKASKK